MKNPSNAREWQEAVDAAEACLTLHAARCYGLVSGGPEVDVGRCEQILAEGKRRRFEPSKDCIERFVTGLIERQQPSTK